MLTPLSAQLQHDPDVLLMRAKTPSRSFFRQRAIDLAPALLGTVLIHETPEGPVGGFIVETESYTAEGDPGCHAYNGKTNRNWMLFEDGGHAYIYLIYGRYWCMNVSAEIAGVGTGVLIRGLEPLVGLDQMARNRGTLRPVEWGAGPGRLTMAMGIDQSRYGTDLADGRSPLRIVQLARALRPEFDVYQGRRIGITHPEAIVLPWRFTVRGNPYVSRPREF